MKIGSALLGWLSALGATAALTALIAVIGVIFGFATDLGIGQAVEGAAESAGAIGIVGAIVAAVILFAAYFLGGYVAGRMARFDGIRQGVAVWLGQW